MISGGGVAIGSVGVVQAATVAAASPTVAGRGAVGGKESFAEVMRESTQTDAAQVGAKSSAEIAKAPDAGVVAKDTGAKSSVRVSSGQTAKQASGTGNVAADEDVTAETAPVPAQTKNAPVVKASTSDVAAQVPEDIAAGAQVEKPVVMTSGGSALKLPVVGKSAGYEHGKTKTTVATKAVVHPESKVAQVATTTAGDGATPAVLTSNVAAGDAKPSGSMPVSAVPQAAVPGVAGDKAAKEKTSSTGDAVAPTATPTNATSDVSAAGASVGGTSPVVVSAGVLSVASAASASAQAGGVAGLPIHTVNPVTSSVTAGQNREATTSVSVAAGHSQGSGAGDVTLSAYDAGKPNQLEVGLQGGEFGWLKVRAEMGTNGEVNAYLRGASTNTTDLLQVQAPKIEAYLGTQDVAVRSVQVEAAHEHTGEAASGFAGDGAPASGGGTAQQQPSGRNDGGSNEGVQGVSESASVDAEREGVAAMQMIANQNSIALTGIGNWLSVRA